MKNYKPKYKAQIIKDYIKNYKHTIPNKLLEKIIEEQYIKKYESWKNFDTIIDKSLNNGESFEEFMIR